MGESASVVVSRSIRVAAGVFAPGHLGELTQFLPFELVDDALEQTRTVQRRLRALPSRVGVYFVLAMVMFPQLGYARVWDKLTAGLSGLALPRPSEKALRDLRRRLGPAPMKVLFETVAGPTGRASTPGTCYRGLRTVAFDGCNSVKVPDTTRNQVWLGRIRYRMGWAGYPTVRLMALVETGTRALLGAAWGSATDRDEAHVARRLLPLLRPGQLLLADRAFDASAFLAAVDATGAKLVVRGKSTRNPEVLEQLPDGSYRSALDGLAVRIIEADLVAVGADGSRVHDSYRLITTLLDHDRYPALELLRLYHERWEIELAFLALRHTILDGHVLRSGDQPGLEQEIWALLTVYQLLRRAMTEAVESVPGTDPDRASFHLALHVARDQVTTAAGIYPEHPHPGIGVIGQAVLRGLLPPRRARYSVRKVKSATSRYLGRDHTRPHRSTTIVAIDITVHPPATTPPRRPKRRSTPTHHDRVTALMTTDPHRAWRGCELAQHLHVKTRTLLTQLGKSARLGLLTRTTRGTYTLPDTTLKHLTQGPHP